MSGGLENLVMLVILVGLAISQLVELVFKPLLLDAGVVLPDNLRKLVIYAMLLLLGVAAALGLDLDYASNYLAGYGVVLTALVSAMGYAGAAGVSHDLLKRLRGEIDGGAGTLLPFIEYLEETGQEVLGTGAVGETETAGNAESSALG